MPAWVQRGPRAARDTSRSSRSPGDWRGAVMPCGATDVATCLWRTLQSFRQSQLAYHARAGLAHAFYPPQHSIATDSACALLAAP
jgi:hypothetical protein